MYFLQGEGGFLCSSWSSTLHENLAYKKCVHCIRTNWAPWQFNSSMTSQCCSIFKLIHEDSYQLWRTHWLLAAVRAANECIQAAQLEEGGKGKVRTMNSQVRSELRHVSKNALTGFMLTCFCTIYLVSTMSTTIDSISQVTKNLTSENNTKDHGSTKILPHEKYLLYSTLAITLLMLWQCTHLLSATMCSILSGELSLMQLRSSLSSLSREDRLTGKLGKKISMFLLRVVSSKLFSSVRARAVRAGRGDKSDFHNY